MSSLQSIDIKKTKDKEERKTILRNNPDFMFFILPAKQFKRRNKRKYTREQMFNAIVNPLYKRSISEKQHVIPHTLDFFPIEGNEDLYEQGLDMAIELLYDKLKKEKEKYGNSIPIDLRVLVKDTKAFFMEYYWKKGNECGIKREFLLLCRRDYGEDKNRIRKGKVEKKNKSKKEESDKKEKNRISKA